MSADRADPSHRREASDVEASAFYAAHVVSAAGSDASSTTSSAASVPSFAGLRRTHLVQALLVSPATVMACAAVVYAGWSPHRLYGTELGLGAVGLLASEVLRQPLARLAPPISLRPRLLAASAPLFAASAMQEAVRLFVVAVSASLAAGESRDAGEPPASAFQRALWLGLGAGAGEVALRSAELLRQVSLYRDVLEPAEGAVALATPADDRPYYFRGDDDGADSDVGQDEAVEMIEAHLRARERVAIVETYGVGLDRIPAFLLALWSLNSVLLSLALSAWLYLGYLSPTPGSALDPPLAAVWLAVTALHGILSTLWIVLLPTFGLAPVSFASFVVLLLLNLLAFAAWAVIR